MTGEVSLRDVTAADLPILFEHQLDEGANRLAAVSARDRDGFMEHWGRLLTDESVFKNAVLLDGRLAGHMVCFERSGEREVGYWLGREFWGRGIATGALQQLLHLVAERPIFARTATDNIGSIGVLQRCGFKIIGNDKGFAHGRDAEIEEYILRLDGERADG